MVTGDYHTVAENNIFGYLQSQVTTGSSYNYVMLNGTYQQANVGTYTTTATKIDEYGTVLETTTDGNSTKPDPNDNSKTMITGDYHTVAENNIFGYLQTQVTTGNSYNCACPGNL